MLQEGHQRLFDPPLPAKKQAAIEKLAIGVVDKLFIRFHSAKQPAAEGSGASEPADGGSGPSHQPLWKVYSTVGNAGFNPTTQPASESADAGGAAAKRTVLSHQLLWKVCEIVLLLFSMKCMPASCLAGLPACMSEDIAILLATGRSASY